MGRAIDGLWSDRSFEAGLGALLILNLFDGLLTLLWVTTGLATEANPVMAQAMETGAAPFLLSKVALVGLAVLLLYRNRHLIGARVAIVPLCGLYALVGGGHVGFALSQVFGLAPALG